MLVRGGNNVGTMIDRLDIPTPEEIWAELASLCQHKLNARLGWLSQKAGYLCFQLHYCASYYFDVSVFFLAFYCAIGMCRPNIHGLARSHIFLGCASCAR